MERSIENLEAVIEQLSQRNDDLVTEKMALLSENDALVADNVELRRQLASMRAA